MKKMVLHATCVFIFQSYTNANFKLTLSIKVPHFAPHRLTLSLLGGQVTQHNFNI